MRRQLCSAYSSYILCHSYILLWINWPYSDKKQVLHPCVDNCMCSGYSSYILRHSYVLLLWITLPYSDRKQVLHPCIDNCAQRILHTYYATHTYYCELLYLILIGNKFCVHTLTTVLGIFFIRNSIKDKNLYRRAGKCHVWCHKKCV